MIRHLLGRVRVALRRPSMLAILVCCSGFPPRAVAAQSVRPCAPFDSAAANLSRFAAQILSDTTAGAQSFRLKFGVPVGTAADVSVIQDNTVCDAATAGAEAAGVPHQTAAFVTVQLTSTKPFYLVTQRTSLGPSTIFFLDGSFAYLTEFR